MSIIQTGGVGAERQFVYLSPALVASNSTDAINGSQLYAMNSTVSAVASLSTSSVATHLSTQRSEVVQQVLGAGSTIASLSTSSTTTYVSPQKNEALPQLLGAGSTIASLSTIQLVSPNAGQASTGSTALSAAAPGLIVQSLSTMTSTGFSISTTQGGKLDESISVQVNGSLSTISYATQLTGSSGAETIKGGVDVELIEGGKGDDTLYGGGNTSISFPDDIWGHTYSDTFVFQKGDGKDRIVDLLNSDMVTTNSIHQARIVFKDVTPSEVSITVDGNFINIHYGESDQITLFYSVPTSMSSMIFAWSGLQQIVFSNGVVWEGSSLRENIKALATASEVNGTAGNDRLVAQDGKINTINGLGGDDVLIGSTGKDVLNGGAGNDTFSGGGGYDGDLWVG